ncbi:MAG: hypothetical protein E6F97_02590 [Actinobacteria bacterium]|nr:MAG: hypothetical protein E6F97_02590 [Actinomycetota bacterium]
MGDHLAPLGHERTGAGASDSARGAGHEHALSREAGVHGVESYRGEGLRHQRHGGNLRNRSPAPNGREPRDVRGGPQALHGGHQRSRPRRAVRRRHGDRRHGLSRRRQRERLQLAGARAVVGMHPMAGTGDGVMNHTVSGRDWQNLWFNDTLVGETGINAALCGTWGCPVLLVTGDEAACREAKALLGDGLTTVAVKEGLSALSARMLAPARARELVEAGAKQAVSKLQAVEPYDPGKPSEIRVEFKSTIPASKLRFRAGVELVDPRTIVSRGDDWWTAWRQFFF